MYAVSFNLIVAFLGPENHQSINVATQFQKFGGSSKIQDLYILEGGFSSTLVDVSTWTRECDFFLLCDRKTLFPRFQKFHVSSLDPTLFLNKKITPAKGDGAKARESYPNKIPAHSKVINNYPTSVVWKLGDARNKCQASRSESVLGVNLRFLNGKMWSLVDCGMFPNGEMDWCTYFWRTWLGHARTLKDMIESTISDGQASPPCRWRERRQGGQRGLQFQELAVFFLDGLLVAMSWWSKTRTVQNIFIREQHGHDTIWEA